MTPQTPSDDELIQVLFQIYQNMGKLRIDGDSADLLSGIRKDIGTIQQVLINRKNQLLQAQQMIGKPAISPGVLSENGELVEAPAC